MNLKTRYINWLDKAEDQLNNECIGVSDIWAQLHSEHQFVRAAKWLRSLEKLNQQCAAIREERELIAMSKSLDVIEYITASKDDCGLVSNFLYEEFDYIAESEVDNAAIVA